MSKSSIYLQRGKRNQLELNLNPSSIHLARVRSTMAGQSSTPLSIPSRSLVHLSPSANPSWVFLSDLGSLRSERLLRLGVLVGVGFLWPVCLDSKMGLVCLHCCNANEAWIVFFYLYKVGLIWFLICGFWSAFLTIFFFHKLKPPPRQSPQTHTLHHADHHNPRDVIWDLWCFDMWVWFFIFFFI